MAVGWESAVDLVGGCSCSTDSLCSMEYSVAHSSTRRRNAATTCPAENRVVCLCVCARVCTAQGPGPCQQQYLSVNRDKPPPAHADLWRGAHLRGH